MFVLLLEVIAGFFIALVVAVFLLAAGVGFLVPFLVVGLLIWLIRIVGSLRTH